MKTSTSGSASLKVPAADGDLAAASPRAVRRLVGGGPAGGRADGDQDRLAFAASPPRRVQLGRAVRRPDRGGGRRLRRVQQRQRHLDARRRDRDPRAGRAVHGGARPADPPRGRLGHLALDPGTGRDGPVHRPERAGGQPAGAGAGAAAADEPGDQRRRHHSRRERALTGAGRRRGARGPHPLPERPVGDGDDHALAGPGGRRRRARQADGHRPVVPRRGEPRAGRHHDRDRRCRPGAADRTARSAGAAGRPGHPAPGGGPHRAAGRARLRRSTAQPGGALRCGRCASPTSATARC